MKGRITTLLSLTGVLVAGSAAALVNTQVLQTSAANTSDAVTIADSTPVNSATQAIYQVGESGLITLDTVGGNLTVVSVTPSTGWILVKAENTTAYDATVQFQSGSTLVEFKASLVQGVVTTSVEATSLSTGQGTPSAIPTQPTVGTQPPAVNTPPTSNNHDDDGEGGSDD